MSPKYKQSDVTKINGPKPSPLRINKDSHAIHKPETLAPKHAPPSPSAAPAAKRQPVIIYTHSPKVIHTQSSDFMALVQKLTGMSRADGDRDRDKAAKAARSEESVASEEKEKIIGGGGPEERYDLVQQQDLCSSAASAPMYKVPSNYVVDAPLFTPNSNEFFCSPRQNQMFQSPTSFMAFPEY